jgi:hypothetical protein
MLINGPESVLGPRRNTFIKKSNEKGCFLPEERE